MLCFPRRLLQIRVKHLCQLKQCVHNGLPVTEAFRQSDRLIFVRLKYGSGVQRGTGLGPGNQLRFRLENRSSIRT